MNTEIETLQTQLAEALERITVLEQYSPQVKAHRELQRQGKENEKRAAEDKALREQEDARRKQIESTRHEYVPVPKKVLCERTGEWVLPTVASHLCDAGRCVHNPKKALAAGQLSRAQYQALVEAGELETGGIIGVAFDAPVDPYADKVDTMSIPPANPLKEAYQPAPVKHLSGGVR